VQHQSRAGAPDSGKASPEGSPADNRSWRRDAEARTSPAILENQIEEAAHQTSMDPPTALDETEKTEHSNAWQTCGKQTSQLGAQRGQVFSVIQNQRAQVLLDKTRRDSAWMSAKEARNPLTLLRLIGKSIPAQVEDQRPPR
jgi:hypothetical protein